MPIPAFGVKSTTKLLPLKYGWKVPYPELLGSKNPRSVYKEPISPEVIMLLPS